MDLWIAVAMRLVTRVIHYPVFSLVILKLEERDKKLHLYSVYVAELNNGI